MSLLRPLRRHGKRPDRAYLEFIRRRPCVVCIRIEETSTWHEIHSRSFQLTPTEAAHVGERGLMQKCSDRETIPLCSEHHRVDRFSHHRLGKKFFEHYGIDRDFLIRELNAKYEAETGNGIGVLELREAL